MSDIVNLLQAAADGRNDEGFDFSLNGDLCQMSSQKNFLIQRCFIVGQSDVYPTLRTEDVKPALTDIWKAKIDGWWHYCKKYVELGICTEQQFKEALDIQCERNKK